MTITYKLAATIASAIIVVTPATASATDDARSRPDTSMVTAQDGAVIDFESTASMPVVTRNALAADGAAAASTRLITGTRRWKIFGATIMWHRGLVTYSYNGRALTNPKSLSHAGGANAGITIPAASDKWNFYGPSIGQSNHYMKFLLGIPTPWGGVGNNVISRLYANVNKAGGYSWAW